MVPGSGNMEIIKNTYSFKQAIYYKLIINHLHTVYISYMLPVNIICTVHIPVHNCNEDFNKLNMWIIQALS